jgi:hypothetical protein
LPGEPIGKRRAAPDSDSLKHRFCAASEKWFRRRFSRHFPARHFFPICGKYCPARAAIISTLTKRRGAFVGKILVKRDAYEIVAARQAQKKSGARAPLFAVLSERLPSAAALEQ